MKHTLIFAILALFVSEAAMAQGVAQSPTSIGHPSKGSRMARQASAIATSSPIPNGTLGSPFSSPFGTSSASYQRRLHRPEVTVNC
jgi:hypothetical protein